MQRRPRAAQVSADGPERVPRQTDDEIERVDEAAELRIASRIDRIGLYESLTGQFTPTGSVGEFTITGGTGRFRGATGGGTFVGVWTDPDLITAHITFEGSLSFAGGNGR